MKHQGFYEPTPIQKRVLPKAVLGRKDIVGAAETGSGKTLAYGLPLLSEILTRRDARAAAALETAATTTTTETQKGSDTTEASGVATAKEVGDVAHTPEVAPPSDRSGGILGSEQQRLEALVLCPTRELALQVAAHLREVVGGTGLDVVVSFHGWTSRVVVSNSSSSAWSSFERHTEPSLFCGFRER